MMRSRSISSFRKAAFLLATGLIAAPVIAQEGFLISIDGAPVAGDTSIARQVSRPDAQLAAADLRIQYDGLTIAPVLDLALVDRSGSSALVETEMNYPAFVTRAELRLYVPGPGGAPHLVATVPTSPNGQARIDVPEGDSYAVLRVYDARGRYDETAPLSLTRADSRLRAAEAEDGTDATARRGIPVYGGAVTVSGADVAPGATVTALGETLRADPSGRFAVQRILPPGQHAVAVQVTGAGQDVDLVRDVDVPRSDAFYVAVADLTFGLTQTGGDDPVTYTDGRLSGYYNARYANGLEVTAQADTGEGPIEDLFRRLEERDPRSVLLRVDPDDLYPTYGDDSTIVDDTPTSGRVFLRIEQDNNYLQWGDDTANITGGYLRNERNLYGLTAHWESPGTTAGGDPRASIDLYAAQPERLPQRDVLEATGGAVYFLNRQDIGIGTETITVQTRDASTGRVIDTVTLVAGQDYSINYIQGVVTLAAPLSSYAGGGIVSTPGGGADVALVVAYEYTPTARDVDTFAYGGRVEGWVTDSLRFGLTATTAETGAGDQRAVGADILWQASENSFVALDYARSEGPGYEVATSSDGGIVFDSTTGAGGSGEAIRLDARVDLQEAGFGLPGTFSFYAEDRTAGFTTLDYDVSADETLWGLALEMQPSERLEFRLVTDRYDSADGTYEREDLAELSYEVTDALTLGVGLTILDKNDGLGEAGSRTDAALRLTYAPSEDLEVYGFVQGTLDRSGTLPANDRVGAGGRLAFARDWTVEGEVSDGDLGPGARVLFRQERGQYDTTYFGYELEPDRDLAGVTLTGTDNGRFILGATRDLGDGLTAFGENSYDLFGGHRALASAYGATYKASDYLSYTGAFEMAQVEDDTNGDYDRTVVSLGVSFQDARRSAAARLEYRREDGSLAGSTRDSETILLTSDLRYQIDEDRRILASFDAATTRGDGNIVESGDLVDASIGYALRPVDNERLNMLFRYRYLSDTYGQQLASDDAPGALQRSHVLSAEASYDINTQWTLGGKIGVRLSETATDASSPWVQNNAALGVLNARYHLLQNWDALVEVRAMHFEQSGTTEFGGLGAIYRQLGPNLSVGVGYDFGTVSSELTDIDVDRQGAFVNFVAQF